MATLAVINFLGILVLPPLILKTDIVANPNTVILSQALTNLDVSKKSPQSILIIFTFYYAMAILYGAYLFQ